MTRRTVYPFKDMQPGDQFVVRIMNDEHPVEVGHRIRQAAHKWAEREFARRVGDTKPSTWGKVLPKFSIKLTADRFYYVITRLEDE